MDQSSNLENSHSLRYAPEKWEETVRSSAEQALQNGGTLRDKFRFLSDVACVVENNALTMFSLAIITLK